MSSITGRCICLIVVLLLAAFVFPLQIAADDDGWGSLSKAAGMQRKNDLPGNPDDVDRRNVFSASNKEIYNEYREIQYKLKQLDTIEQSERKRWSSDEKRLGAVEENRRRLNQRKKQLDDEIFQRKYIKKKWDGFVPGTSEHEPLDPKRGKIPDPKWGGPLPKVSKKNPSTMGRSQIEPEMIQLTKDARDLRKRQDNMNKVGDFAGKLGQKQQVEAKLKEVINRLKALNIEKKRQIKNGTWPQNSSDIIRTKASKKDIDKAYQAGKSLARSFRNGNMSSAEVRSETQIAYDRYRNNAILKKEFKRGYGDGAQ